MEPGRLWKMVDTIAYEDFKGDISFVVVKTTVSSINRNLFVEIVKDHGFLNFTPYLINPNNLVTAPSIFEYCLNFIENNFAKGFFTRIETNLLKILFLRGFEECYLSDENTSYPKRLDFNKINNMLFNKIEYKNKEEMFKDEH